MAYDKQLRAMLVALERSAKAQEDLLALAKEEQVTFEPGPSVCPGCGKYNPEVTQLATDGSGNIDEFVFIGETHCCNKTIYAIPDSFAMVTNKDEAVEIVNQKGGNNGKRNS